MKRELAILLAVAATAIAGPISPIPTGATTEVAHTALYRRIPFASASELEEGPCKRITLIIAPRDL